ncbi:MAG: type II toxin-antitoxin system mRNA interferase toxin, RelE/StbE family [Patescibacteria group bacterium]|nr:type II toxin-antitoxin system YafQ family toxin [Patescibacteria group bacterium]
MKTRLVLSSAFKRQLKRLIKKNPPLKNKVNKVLKTLLKGKNSPSLKIHKLSGENNWSVSVTYEIRIVVHLDAESIFCLRIGTHDQVY